MRRFFIENIEPGAGSFIIPEKEARHMVKVLRMKQGDRFILMTAEGLRFEAEIEGNTNHGLSAKITGELQRPEPSPVEIKICQALLRSRKMDYLIEKTSELGISAILPFFSERTVIKLDDKKQTNKLRHWKEITRSAVKQSGKDIPAVISEPVPFDSLISNLRDAEGLKTVLWEGENTRDLKEVLRAKGPEACFTGVIGPEGGFTPGEIEMLKKGGVTPVSLGTRILRAETAAITLAAIIQYEWGDLGIV